MRSPFLLIAFAAMASFAIAQGDNSAKPGDKHLKMRIAVAAIDYGANNWFDSWQIPVEFRNAIDDKLAKKLFDTGRFIVLDRESMQNLVDEKAIKEDNT